MTSCLAYLTGHHDKGCGEPVAAEHLALGTDEGQVEPHRGRRREIWSGSGRRVVLMISGQNIHLWTQSRHRTRQFCPVR